VGLVLLVVVANVSNLMLGRALARSREMSIRAAIGAGRWAIARQLLTESMLLGVAGGLLGLVLARWAIHGFALAVADVGKPYWIEFTFDWTVFLYFAAVCLLTGVLFGLVPAWQASRLDLASSMRDNARAGVSRSTRWITGSLVVAELALSVILLAGAGLMIRSFMEFGRVNAQLPAAEILQFYLVLPEEKYKAELMRQQVAEKLLALLGQTPGTRHAALSSHEPMGGRHGWEMELEDAPVAAGAKRPAISGLVVTPDYFAVMNMAPVQGRGLREDDGMAGRENIVVNAAFAAKYFPARPALGRRLRLEIDGKKSWLTIAGVVPDVTQDNPQRDEREPLLYLPWRFQPQRFMTVLLRAQVSPAALVTPARRLVAEVDAEIPLTEPMTVQEKTERRRWSWRVFGTMFSAFSLIGVTLAAVGLYGVVAHGVRQRTAEIGIRLALGATAGRVLALVLGGGLRQVALGLAVGLAGAFALTRFLQALLVRVSPADPVTFIAVALLLSLVGLVACYLPARRAAAIDPVRALRCD